MAKQEAQSVGSGITVQTVHSVSLDPSNPEDAKAIIEWMESMPGRLNEPWGPYAQMIAAARQVFTDFEAELQQQQIQPGTKEYVAHFKERDTAAWYVKEIVKTARAVEIAIENQRPWEAATRAMMIGELLAESRLKEWDKPALFGQKRLAEVREQGLKSRRSSKQSRIDDVERLVNEGLKVTNAIRKVAKNHGVSEAAIRKDVYPRKSTSTSSE